MGTTTTPNVVGYFSPGKNPGDSLPFSWDWGTWLAIDANGVRDSIVTATITATPSGLNVGPTTLDAGHTVATATISGGVSGISYFVECDVVTASGMIACSQEVLNVRDDVR